MKGRVDGSGRAFVRIAVKRTPTSPRVELEAWLDTGFTGELVLPKGRVSALGLSQAGVVKVGLGDGSQVILATFSCWLDWFGEENEIQVVGSSGQFPLLV